MDERAAAADFGDRRVESPRARRLFSRETSSIGTLAVDDELWGAAASVADIVRSPRLNRADWVPTGREEYGETRGRGQCRSRRSAGVLSPPRERLRRADRTGVDCFEPTQHLQNFGRIGPLGEVDAHEGVADDAARNRSRTSRPAAIRGSLAIVFGEIDEAGRTAPRRRRKHDRRGRYSRATALPRSVSVGNAKLVLPLGVETVGRRLGTDRHELRVVRVDVADAPAADPAAGALQNGHQLPR